MPRALTLQRTVVPAAERRIFLERLRQRRAHYTRAQCNFWVFEEAGLPGAFLEFTEAVDLATLAAAHGAAPHAGLLDPGRMYTEVTLS